MRFKGFVIGVVLGDFIYLKEPLEESLASANDPYEGLNGDVKYTPCQAKLMRENDIEIFDVNIINDINDDEYCEQLLTSDKRGLQRGALDNSVRYWKDHYSALTNRYKIPYMFDGSHSDKQMNVIRRKLSEFRQETCVDLVEIPWEENHDGSFANKYDNVFWVSLTTFYSKVTFDYAE